MKINHKQEIDEAAVKVNAKNDIILMLILYVTLSNYKITNELT
jgi:hypothetical protein